MRNTWHRHDIRLCPHTTQSINHQQWEPPTIKRSELKSFDNTERSLEDTLPWTDTLKANCHSDGTSIPFPTGVPATKIWTGFGTSYATTYLHKLQDKRRNRPISKCGEGLFRRYTAVDRYIKSKPSQRWNQYSFSHWCTS